MLLLIMPKADRKPDPDFEPNYDMADADFDDIEQISRETGSDVEYEVGADAEYEVEVQEGHDVGADVEFPDVVADLVPEVMAGPELIVMAVASTEFAYEVGGLVVPAPAASVRAVVWRGLLKERHPATGLVLRVPVYRLDDGYWDCYREEELRAA